MVIGDNVWIGQQAFLHSAGGLTIGNNVGIGPAVKIHTSRHREVGRNTPIVEAPIEDCAVFIGDGADLGVGSIIMPGVRIGVGAQIGAGAVVTRDVPDFAVAAGVPARILRIRSE
jgi:acetyltransferase-like isoleucine patch superfamily enzyme